MKLKFDKLLKNKIVLFVTFFLALVTLFGYLVRQNYPAILFFTLVLFLTKHFSNNMIVILGVSIIATNLLDLFRVFSNGYLENMENIKGKNDEKQPSKNVRNVLNYIAAKFFDDEIELNELVNKDTNKTKNLKKINKEDVETEIVNIEKNVNKLSFSDINYLLDLAKYYMSAYKLLLDSSDDKKQTANYKLYIELIESSIIILTKVKAEKEMNEDKNVNETEQSIDTEFGFNKCKPGEIFDQQKNQCMPAPKKNTKVKCANEEVYDEKQKKCVKKDSKSKKEAMTTLNPAPLSDSNYGFGNLTNFDEAKVKELAFDNLDKIIGNDNIRSLNNKSNEINNRQDQLMTQLKDVGPLMNQAMSLIKNIDMDALNNVSNQMTGMINNLQSLKN